jgi:hypothetical protein
MLDVLGVAYIQGSGEAEKMCAALNAAGVSTDLEASTGL